MIPHADLIRSWMKYRTATMCDESVFAANIELAERVRHLEGVIVECGVWRGGMIAAIAEVLGANRHYVLCDSFMGLPPAQEIDGHAAQEWQRTDPNNCRATANEARETMRVAGITSYQVLEGWFEDTLHKFDAEIALLRLDADWYDSTSVCLLELFDKVVPNGIIIIDDYYVWDGCSRAVHEFLGVGHHVERIREHNGVAYMVKV